MKNNKILYAIILVLVAIVCLLSGFIIGNGNLFNKESNKEQVENNDKREKVTELELSSTLVTTLSKSFYGNFLNTGASDYDNYFYKNNKTDIASLSDELKAIITFRSLGNQKSIKLSDFELAYKQIFGGNVIVPSINKTNDCLTLYELVDGFYEIPVGGCGGTTGSVTYSKLIKAEQIQTSTSDKIIISEAVAFMTYKDNSEALYKDYQFTEFVEDYTYDMNKNPLDYVDYSKYALYDYTFVKDSTGIYVFTSVERVK